MLLYSSLFIFFLRLKHTNLEGEEGIGEEEGEELQLECKINKLIKNKTSIPSYREASSHKN